MPHDDLTIIAAKVAVLERVVRALLGREFSMTADPLAAAQDYAERLKRRLDGKLEGDLHDQAATILTVENIDIFFDPLLQQLKGDQG